MLFEPLVATLPDQAPEAVHAVASVADQVSVALSPLATREGLALNLTVGVAPEVFATVAVTYWIAVPPAPVQEIL